MARSSGSADDGRVIPGWGHRTEIGKRYAKLQASIYRLVIPQKPHCLRSSRTSCSYEPSGKKRALPATGESESAALAARTSQLVCQSHPPGPNEHLGGRRDHEGPWAAGPLSTRM